MKIELLGIFLAATVLIGISETFAAEITIETDKDFYQGGDTISLSGNLDVGVQGDLIGLEVKDAADQTILIRTVKLDSQGNFNLDFKVPTTAKSGTFAIIVNVLVDGQTTSMTKGVQIIAERTPDSDQGGCLIATATYGSELAPQVQQLRELRDNKLLQTESGSAFMESFNDFYYAFSPYIADFERENPMFREAVKLAITPMISSLSILNHVDMETEEEVLGYGISLILLNVGMYVGVPAIVIVGIRKRF